MCKHDDQPMSSWVSDIKNAAFQLESAGVPVIDKDIILALTEELPDAFSTLIVTLDSIPHDLDLTNVVTQLLNEEVQQRNDRIGRPGSECNDEQVLTLAHKKRLIEGIFASTAKEGGTTSQTVHPQSWQQLQLRMEVTKMRLYLLSRFILTMTTTPLEKVELFDRRSSGEWY